MMDRKQWLDKLYYDIGKQQYDFRLNGLKKVDGEPKSTRWKKYSELVFPVDINESWKIDYINNREILPNEIVIDLEERTTIRFIVKKLKKHKITFYVFDTGSRGYHIHIFGKRNYSNKEKMAFTKRFFGDEQKAYNGTTIALEYAPHWKSNKIKRLIEWK